MPQYNGPFDSVSRGNDRGRGRISTGSAPSYQALSNNYRGDGYRGSSGDGRESVRGGSRASTRGQVDGRARGSTHGRGRGRGGPVFDSQVRLLALINTLKFSVSAPHN